MTAIHSTHPRRATTISPDGPRPRARAAAHRRFARRLLASGSPPAGRDGCRLARRLLASGSPPAGRASWLAALCLLLALVGCRQPVGQGPDVPEDAAPPADGYPPPRTDLVPRVGSDAALDLATWNIENFPHDASTPAVIADLIASLDLDLIAVQEIASISAFNEVIDRLPGFAGVLSSHTYGDGSFQKVGFLYREALLEPRFDTLLFVGQGFAFPRPALRVDFGVVGTEIDFTAIALHLKAGLDDRDIERRTEGVRQLEEYVRAEVDGLGDEDVILLGDFNERVTGQVAEEVWAPLLGAPDRYRVHTAPLAVLGQFSFIPAAVMLDHVVTTAALADELAGGATVIPRLDAQVFGYEDGVSDHLPVVVSMPVAPQSARPAGGEPKASSRRAKGQ